jgi:hypothetical protein
MHQIYKSVLFFSAIFSFSAAMYAQAPMKWGWAKSIGGTGNERPADMAADSRNGVYVLGDFSGSITAGSNTLTSSGGTSIYLIKYDTLGNIRWAKTFGSGTQNRAGSLVTDRSSNIIINGSFEGSITFGSTVLTSSGASDVFTVKLRPDGTVVWAKQFTGSLADNAGPMECDHLLNIYMAGTYTSSGFNIDGTSFTATAGYSNIYYCKLDSNGSRIWARVNISSTPNSLQSLDVLPSGNLLMHGSMTAGGFPGVNYNPNIYNGMLSLYASIFTIKLRQDGGFMLQGNVPDRREFAGGTALTASKKIVKAGYRTLSSNASAFAHLYLCDSNNSYIREKSVNNLNFNNTTSLLRDVTTTKAGRIYAAGHSYGNNGYGSITLNTPNSACLLWELDDTLGTRNVLSIAGQTNTSHSIVKVVTDTTTGNVYAAGSFSAPGMLTIGSNILPAYGQDDVFAGQVMPGKILTAYAGADTTICAGATATISGTAAGGVSPYTYSWSPVAGLSASTLSSTQASPVATTTYILTVTDSSGSIAKDTVVVNVNPQPATPSVSAGGPVSFCQGDSVVLTSSTGSSYLWSTGATTQSITVNNSGNYSVQITNTNGCQSAASAAAMVTVNPLPPVATITQAGNTLTSSAASGNQWHFNGTAIAGATGQSYTYSTGGNYFVTVTNASGCSSGSAVLAAMRMASTNLDNSNRFYHQVAPNPVTGDGNTVVRYQLTFAAEVSVYAADTRGQQVLLLVSGRQQVAGIYSLAIGNKLQALGRGMYYIVYVINGKKITEPVLVQ